MSCVFACTVSHESFPDDERYGLSAQTRRSAVSVVSNIAEGYERHQTNEYIQFLRIAKGSLAEFETQLMLSRDLGYVDGEELAKLLENVQEIERMLQALIRSLKNKRA